MMRSLQTPLTRRSATRRSTAILVTTLQRIEFPPSLRDSSSHPGIREGGGKKKGSAESTRSTSGNTFRRRLRVLLAIIEIRGNERARARARTYALGIEYLDCHVLNKQLRTSTYK